MRVTSGAQQDPSHVGNISWSQLRDVVEAEAGLSAHGAVCRHSNLGGRAGRRHNKIVGNKMELILVPVFLRVNLDIIPIVDLLIVVFVHLCRNFRFIGNSDVQGVESLRSTKIILAEVWEVWFVERIDLNLALDGVYHSVVHDGLDVLLLGDLEELLSIGRSREIFCRGEKEELILYILNRQRVDDDYVDYVDGVDEGSFRPGDGVGRDRPVDHAVVGEGTAIEGHTRRISFNFSGKGQEIVPS